MPQLSQLSEVYLSQFLWLAIALGFIFFVIARGMVPKIQATVDAREQQDRRRSRGCAEGARAADETEAAWRARMDAARAEAARIAQEAKARERARHRGEGQGGGRQDQLPRSNPPKAKIREALASAHVGDRSCRGRSGAGDGRSG